MGESVIVSNEYIKIYVDSRDIYIESFKKGFPVEHLNNLLSSHPEIGVTSFSVLRNSIVSAPKKPEKFGELKEGISIDVSDDWMKATVVYNLPPEKLNMNNREMLKKDTLDKLSGKEISFGIKRELLHGGLQSGKTYIIAEGIPPIDGRDSVIRMYELEDAKPAVDEDGKVDFYEMKLINRVKAGDWLGERLDATEGIPGQNIKGETVKAVQGKNLPLNYDKNSVLETYEEGITTLYARINGAVNYTNGKIGVSNHLEIDGDVNLGTGNIKFDGYLTIKGTVVDGFSVEATKDIEINGDFGLGNVRGITSTGGSIYIKGGIASKGKAEITAAKNIYTKFVDNAVVSCSGTIHIGYYCFNSIVNAKELIMDSSNGQIVGGQVCAEIRVSSPVIGSEIEKKTQVEVTGFNKASMVERLEGMVQRLSELKNEQQRIKQTITYFEEQEQLNPFQRKEYNDALEKAFSIKDEVKNLEEERKSIASYLKTHGEGEICVSKKIHPNCVLIIKKNIMEITMVTTAVTYYYQDGALKQV